MATESKAGDLPTCPADMITMEEFDMDAPGLKVSFVMGARRVCFMLSDYIDFYAQPEQVKLVYNKATQEASQVYLCLDFPGLPNKMLVRLADVIFLLDMDLHCKESTMFTFRLERLPEAEQPETLWSFAYAHLEHLWQTCVVSALSSDHGQPTLQEAFSATLISHAAADLRPYMLSETSVEATKAAAWQTCMSLNIGASDGGSHVVRGIYLPGGLDKSRPLFAPPAEITTGDGGLRRVTFVPQFGSGDSPSEGLALANACGTRVYVHDTNSELHIFHSMRPHEHHKWRVTPLPIVPIFHWRIYEKHTKHFVQHFAKPYYKKEAETYETCAQLLEITPAGVRPADLDTEKTEFYIRLHKDCDLPIPLARHATEQTIRAHFAGLATTEYEGMGRPLCITFKRVKSERGVAFDAIARHYGEAIFRATMRREESREDSIQRVYKSGASDALHHFYANGHVLTLSEMSRLIGLAVHNDDGELGQTLLSVNLGGHGVRRAAVRTLLLRGIERNKVDLVGRVYHFYTQYMTAPVYAGILTPAQKEQAKAMRNAYLA